MDDIKFINLDPDSNIKDINDWLNINENIYKYMPIKHILSSFDKQYLYLVRPSEWKDPYESRFLNADLKGVTDDDRLFLQNIYCTCFNQSSTSSEAHWNAYTTDHLCGRLVINRVDLYNELKKHIHKYDIYITSVSYRKAYNGNGRERKLWKQSNFNFKQLMLNLLTIKRRPYAYEEECRIIFIPKHLRKGRKIVKLRPFKWEKITSHIYVDPNVDNSIFAVIKEYLETKYDNIKVTLNALYEVPQKLCIDIENNTLRITKIKS